MKSKIILAFCLGTLLFLFFPAYSQYSPIIYGTLSTDDYTTVNRKYFTVPTSGLNDGQAHLLSVMELSREMARAAVGFGIYSSPVISATPATYAPSTLVNPNFSGPFVPPNPRFRITKVNYSPVPCNGKNLRLIIVRPNDNVIRPCIMVSHGKSANMGDFVTYFANGADYLMRGYVVAFYENSEAFGVEVSSDISCGSSLWATFQPSIYRGFQYAIAATKYMKGNAATYGVDNTKFFASGYSFGSICSMMLAFADAGNFNHASFAEPGGTVNFNAKTFPIYQNQIVTNIKAVAPIATAIPLPGAGNNIGNIFDAGDNGTSVIFIHGGKEQLFRLATTTAPYAPITDFPAGCTQAGVKVETPLALRTRMSTYGIQSKAVINCEADHATFIPAAPMDPYFILYNPLLTGIDFDVNPSSTFVSKNQEWLATIYVASQTLCYSNVISQQFRAKIAIYTPLQPSSPDGVDGVRPANFVFVWPFVTDGTVLSGNCYYNGGSVAFKAMEEPEMPVTELILFPNPTSRSITVAVPTAPDADLALQIINLQGVQVLQSILPMGASSRELDLQDLSAGIYILRMQHPDGHATTRKFVKQ